jgi:hypothetical protein
MAELDYHLLLQEAPSLEAEAEAVFQTVQMAQAEQAAEAQAAVVLVWLAQLILAAVAADQKTQLPAAERVVQVLL